MGRYQVEVKTKDGRSGSASFTVDDLTPEDSRRPPGRRPIEIQVR